MDYNWQWLANSPVCSRWRDQRFSKRHGGQPCVDEKTISILVFDKEGEQGRDGPSWLVYITVLGKFASLKLCDRRPAISKRSGHCVDGKEESISFIGAGDKTDGAPTDNCIIIDCTWTAQQVSRTANSESITPWRYSVLWRTISVCLGTQVFNSNTFVEWIRKHPDMIAAD